MPKTWMIAALVVLVTGLVFSGVTKLEWTNWDDDEYVTENRMVLDGDYKAIFTKPVNNNYNPLPVAMMAWEWSQVTPKAVNGEIQNDMPEEEKARLFHINNLWMHCVCTFLVFWLMTLLGLRPIWAALAALMSWLKVSVLSISERKAASAAAASARVPDARAVFTVPSFSARAALSSLEDSP